MIADVNGEEVTIAELNEEARARGLSIGADPSLQQALLQDLVDRKLLVQAARQEKLDRTPEYLLASRRASELALAQQLIARRTGEVGRLTSEQLRGLVDDNPHIFGARAMLAVQQVTFNVPQETDPRFLSDVDSLASLKADLASRNIPFSESRENWDSAALDKRSATRLLSAEAGDGVLLLQTPGKTTAVQLLAKSPQPVEPQRLEPTALELIRNQRAQQAAEQSIAAARKAGKISFQRGYEPER